MNGRAPNWFVTGFHSLLARNPGPKVRRLGKALRARTMAMRPSSTRMATPAAPEPARKRASPQDDPVGWSRARRASRRNGKAMEASDRAQVGRGSPLKVIVWIVASSWVTTAAGKGAYVRDAAVVCPVWTAHQRNATRACAFAWVIPLG